MTVPDNGASYGDNNVEDYGGSWQFVADTVDAWYDAQVAAGKTPAQIDAYLAQFDVWDRYDFDGDGNFDEPDGYIDHFQAVHAGEGEEAGGARGGRHLVAPLVRLRRRLRRHRPAAATYSAARRSATPASGSATTPPSPRTAVSASSPTSTATTSACPTTTTPRAARTAPPSGR